MGARVLWVVIALVLIAAAAPAVITLLWSRALVYHPTGLSDRELSELAARPGWTSRQLEAAPGVRIYGLVRAPRDPDAPWLLFFGGNAYDLASSQYVLEEAGGAKDWGLAAFAYRGYDASDGEPSEAALLEDARLEARHLESEHGVKPERLVLIGQSLGSGVAAALASRLSTEGQPPAGLVLLSPFTAIRDLFEERVPLVPVGWAVRDPFLTRDRIGSVQSPVLLIHGAADRLIPPSHAEKLAAQLGDRAELVLLPERDHNDLWEKEDTGQVIVRFVERVTGSR